MNYKLDDVEERNKRTPEFEIPTRDLRETLRPGDIVQLVFLPTTHDHERGEMPSGERMWVEIAARWEYARGPTYVGPLLNEPTYLSVRQGASISFGSENICSIMLDDGPTHGPPMESA